MVGRFFRWLVNKLRFKRFALSGNVKLLEQYGFYYGHYANWKHDPNPLIFVMYSGPDYTHGINVHYMSSGDKQWFGRMLFLLKKGGQVIDGLTMYRLLKLRRINIVKTCYRVYFTRLLNMKLAGAGLTDLDRLVYPVTRDPWLLALNEMMRRASSELLDGFELRSSATYVKGGKRYMDARGVLLWRKVMHLLREVELERGLRSTFNA